MVVAGAILTGTLVVGRNYGPTYYAQYGGNLQQAGMIIKFNVFIQCEKINERKNILYSSDASNCHFSLLNRCSTARRRKLRAILQPRR